MNYSLEPIEANPLGKENAMHLLNRSTMGSARDDYHSFAALTISEALDLLLDAGVPPPPPLQIFGTDPNVPFGDTWVDAPLDGNVRFNRKKSLRSWWTGTLLNQQMTLREKMVLFWHNHFVTETNVVGIPAYLYDYNVLIRQYATGNFKELTKKMTVNTAMLRYLDGIKNTAASPNENYARELFELFTIGKGPLIGDGNYTYYTEQDVQEGARVLTGWKVNNSDLSAWFNTSKHDTGNKTFSDYYGNQSITDQGSNEYSVLIDMIFDKKQTARTMVRKLYRWFVYYQIDEEVETQIIEPLTDTFFDNGYLIQPVLRKLLSSQHFFDHDFRGSYIKNPIEFTLGTLRKLEVEIPEDLMSAYEFWNLFYFLSSYQEMELGTPPDVAGWPAYYLEPGFNELWINSATLPQKAEFTSRLLGNSYTRNGITLKVDVIALAEATSQPSNPVILITELCELLLPVSVSSEVIDELKEVLIPGLPDFEWTVEWNNYLGDPNNTTLKEAVENALGQLLDAIMHSPQYYLM